MKFGFRKDIIPCKIKKVPKIFVGPEVNLFTAKLKIP